MGKAAEVEHRKSLPNREKRKRYIHVRLDGIITSGKAKASHFTQLPWALEQITKQLGFTPYPGTLNLKLDQKNQKKLTTLFKTINPIKIKPHGSLKGADCIRCQIKDSDCAIIIPDIPEYGPEIAEVLAPVNLREKFNLRDGNQISIAISEAL